MGVALDKFHNNPGLGTTGDCAKQVRAALNEGGFNVGTPSNGSVDAKDYGQPLTDAGFDPVISGTKPSTPPTDNTLKPGDVAVIQPTTASPSGHMQIYDGDRWYPKFPRDEFWPGPGYRDERPDYTIYRYPGE